MQNLTTSDLFILSKSTLQSFLAISQTWFANSFFSFSLDINSSLIYSLCPLRFCNSFLYQSESTALVSQQSMSCSMCFRRVSFQISSAILQDQSLRSADLINSFRISGYFLRRQNESVSYAIWNSRVLINFLEITKWQCSVESPCSDYKCLANDCIERLFPSKRETILMVECLRVVLISSNQDYMQTFRQNYSWIFDLKKLRSEVNEA